jgi:uncharacterized protein (TIGR03086 family)
MSPDAETRSLRVLGHALDQVGDVLDHVRDEHLSSATPCSDWTVADLVDHLVASPRTFVTMMRGDDPDWDAAPPRVSEGWASAFRNAADDLVHEWHQLEARGAAPPFPPGMQVAEFAVHGWDLATAVGFPLERLDPEVAEVGLGFMRSALRPEMRGEAFGPERPAPPGAGPYATLAAFAGRAVAA